ncbi:MAG: TRAP transporter fused permease subunit, partial [Onishia taeanensis]|uniref:TRAP transporter permease n=1 Tax=Onishia taeanensis TaxID=284577 RepID=UPI003C79E3F2
MSDSATSPIVPGSQAQHARPILWLIALVAVGLSLFQLYSAGIQPLGLFYQRSIHLALIMMLAFLMFPVFGPNRRRGIIGGVIDLVFFAGALITGGYLVLYLDDIFNRAGFWSQTDIVVGCIATVTVLEASRRAVGLGMTVIGILALLYAFAGPRGELPWLGQFLPGIMEHRGYNLDRVVGQLYLGQEGIFGLPMGVAATYIFIFVLFGAFLEITGAGKFFIDLAYAATGRQRGGPAKAAVLASAGMGSISGSAIANVVTTGAFTIPLMKRLGFKPAQAGGIEAAASTGGQIMPPLMGAGAFLIAEYTQVPYLEVVKVSVLPAILYFATVYLFVHIIALKQGMQGMPRSELPQVRDVMRSGWHFLLPLGVLVWLLVMNMSPMRVGYFAVITMLTVAALRFSVWFLFVAPAQGQP